MAEAGPSTSKAKSPLSPIDNNNMSENMNLVSALCEMFPRTCPHYIKFLCRNKQFHNIDTIADDILRHPDHPKRNKTETPKKLNPNEQLELIQSFLPDADPSFLQTKLQELHYDTVLINEYINVAMEKQDYPTRAEYLKKENLSAQIRQYTTEFDIKHFLELIPDPKKHFKSRQNYELDDECQSYVKKCFMNKFDNLCVVDIVAILVKKDFNIIMSDMELQKLVKMGTTMKTKRKQRNFTAFPHNIPVLQEMAYVMHKTEIKTYIKNIRMRKEKAKQLALANGCVNTCECCFDNEVMVEDTIRCPQNHAFCKDCVKSSCEVALGDNRIAFNCLSDCSEEFTLFTLQNALPPKIFSILAHKKTVAEIKEAGLDDLEMCPFCEFAYIPNETDKLFRCFNPDCMKESCRTCKEPNHFPLKCNEVEKDENVRVRTNLENLMTEALLRECYQCKTKFFKEDGCNKMTCSCGAVMCYVCKKPVTNYNHFNGLGGDNYDLCPLYSDTIEMNKLNVITAAELAKKEMNIDLLKFDPTADIKKHYEEQKSKQPIPNFIPLLETLPNHMRGNHHLENQANKAAQQLVKRLRHTEPQPNIGQRDPIREPEAAKEKKKRNNTEAETGNLNMKKENKKLNAKLSNIKKRNEEAFKKHINRRK